MLKVQDFENRYQKSVVLIDEKTYWNWAVCFDLSKIEPEKHEKVQKLAQYCADVLNEGD